MKKKEREEEEGEERKGVGLGTVVHFVTSRKAGASFRSGKAAQ